MEPTIEIERLNELLDDKEQQIETLRTNTAAIEARLANALAKLGIWQGIADDLADKLATYEAVDHAGIGIQALEDYRKARKDA